MIGWPVAVEAVLELDPLSTPTSTCTAANRASTSAIDQNNRDGDMSLPHNKTTTPTTPTATRSQRAFAATQEPAPAAELSLSVDPTVSRPPETVERAAVPGLLRPVNQPTTIRIRPNQSSTCCPRSRYDSSVS